MVKSNINIEGARIGFRNFSGKEGKYNPKGLRNFCVFLDSDLARRLSSDGWNIKWLEPRDPTDEKQAYLSVTVNFGTIPPIVVLITSKNKTKLDEKGVDILDWAEIQNVDVIIRPYNWDVNGKTGVKAYLKAIYVTIVEDEFADKYRDIPDSGAIPVDDD